MSFGAKETSLANCLGFPLPLTFIRLKSLSVKLSFEFIISSLPKPVFLPIGKENLPGAFNLLGSTPGAAVMAVGAGAAGAAVLEPMFTFTLSCFFEGFGALAKVIVPPVAAPLLSNSPRFCIPELPVSIKLFSNKLTKIKSTA